ncbi:YfcC family protein [Desemzia sp. C1]|uniref:YfcC family protein n=1 Tax=Desemzia sp. C1 TaxID=2892016 RepID=UPI001E4F1D52|nr:YfcC family protein [Desemzia sp. C1]MCI3029187.1 YfcC family protein [Desemzia sp. C1]
MEASQKKKRFNMPSSYTVLFLIILVIAILTWFVPAGEYQVDEAGNILSGSYQVTEQNPQGLWDVFMAPVKGMIGTETTPGAIEVSLFIIVVGGFLGVVNRTGALDTGIAQVVKNYKGKEKLLIPILMFIFALGGTTYGMAEETMAFYPLIIPVMVAVGFDTLVAISVVLLGSGVGVLGSTVNPFATGVASQALGISPGEGILWRLIFFFAMYAIATIFVYRYAVKVQKDPSQSLVYKDYKENQKKFAVADIKEVMSAKQKVVMVLFGLAFFIMILGLVPWSTLNENWTFFETMNQWLMDLPIIGTVLGQQLVPLGNWYFMEITMLFFLMAVIIGLYYRIPEGEIVSTFIEGARDLLGVALVVALARGIQVVMNEGMITATILHIGEQNLSNLSPVLFSILTYVFYIPMSFLIPSTSGLAAATMGIMGPLGGFADVPEHVVITAYQAASGIINLVTPTSGVVMGALAIAGIELTTWWKFTAKLIGIIFIVSCIILGIAAVLG